MCIPCCYQSPIYRTSHSLHLSHNSLPYCHISSTCHHTHTGFQTPLPHSPTYSYILSRFSKLFSVFQTLSSTFHAFLKFTHSTKFSLSYTFHTPAKLPNLSNISYTYSRSKLLPSFPRVLIYFTVQFSNNFPLSLICMNI